MDDYRIVQLLPADGWQALFAISDIELLINSGEIRYTHAELEPLIAWALVEWPDGRQRVTGLCREEYGTSIINEEKDFLGYFQNMPHEALITYELALAQSIADEEAEEKRRANEARDN